MNTWLIHAQGKTCLSEKDDDQKNEIFQKILTSQTSCALVIENENFKNIVDNLDYFLKEQPLDVAKETSYKRAYQVSKNGISVTSFKVNDWKSKLDLSLNAEEIFTDGKQIIFLTEYHLMNGEKHLRNILIDILKKKTIRPTVDFFVVILIVLIIAIGYLLLKKKGFIA